MSPKVKTAVASNDQKTVRGSTSNGQLRSHATAAMTAMRIRK